MKEESNSAWIDDVIKQHKKQLEELKRTKEQKETNPFIVKPSTESSNPSLQAINAIKSFNQSNEKLDLNQSKLQSKLNELTIKIEEKKEKIRTLKQQNNSLIEENDSLKVQLNEMAIKSTIANSNDSNAKTVSQLNQRIKDLECELEQREMKINQMSIIKSQEIDLMNQKIRDFEVIIDENSFNYISNMNKLNKTIEEYKLRIIEADKYVSVVNFFIQKIDSQSGKEYREIYDYKELQSKFVDIEKIIVANNLQNKCRDKERSNVSSLAQPLPVFQNKVLKCISGMSPNAFDDNTIHYRLEDSKLQDEDLVEGDYGNEDNQEQAHELNQGPSLVYKTLEERVNELENEMRKNPHLAKRKKEKDKASLNNSNSLINNNQKDIKGQSKSLTKGIITSNETIATNRKTEVCSTHKKIKKKRKKTKGINTTTNSTAGCNNTNVHQAKKNKTKM